MSTQSGRGMPGSEDVRRAEGQARLRHDLIELIYDASTEPARWQPFVDALSDACGGAGVGMSLHVAEFGTPAREFARALDLGFASVVSRLVETGGVPWLTAPGALKRHLQEFVFGSEFFPDERVGETEFHRVFLAPQGLASEAPLSHVIHLAPSGVQAAIAIHRRQGDRPLDALDLELCNSLVPHLGRAYAIHARLHGERDQRKALAEVVDRMPIGVILVDEAGRCRSVNASAKRLLDLDDGVYLEQDRPALDDRKQNQLVRASIAKAASRATRGASSGSRIMLSVERPSGDPPLTMMVIRLQAAGEASMEGDPVAAVFIADPNAGAMSPSVLQDLYSLTPAESQLVAELMTGRALEDAAERRGIRVSTARGYLKSIFRKTGTSGQPELARLVLTGVARIDADRKALDAP